MSAVIAVNWVPYKDQKRRDQQREAMASLDMPGLVKVVCILEHDFIDHEDALHEDRPGDFPKMSRLLTRDAVDEIGGDRHLPFLKEMMDAAYDTAQTAVEVDHVPKWVGLLNSDIIVTLKGVDKLEELAREDIEVAVVHRRSLRTGQDFMGGVDGFFIRTTSWPLFRQPFPDFVLGEPGWGEGVRDWFQGRTKVSRICDGAFLHRDHPRNWDFSKTPATLHNQGLYQSVQKELKNGNL